MSSQRGFFRALGAGATGSACLELGDGVQATVVPVRPYFSLFNSVLYRDGAALRRTVSALPEVYAAAGARGWSVWVPPGDEPSARLLAEQGYAEEGSPLAMAASIAALRVDGQAGIDIDRSPTWSEVARCNDAAHGVRPEYTMSAAFEAMDDPASRLYAARTDGNVASALIARHVDGDCYFWAVATLPDMQRRGLAGELMRQALHDAAAAGCTTASLEATPAGEPLYRRLGFEDLGRCGRWARYLP